MTNDLDLNNAKDTTPEDAPVSEPEPLTGKEKAGVSLTWGIIYILIAFLIAILCIFSWGESQFFSALAEISNSKTGANPYSLNEMNSLLAEVESQRTAFRTFWFDTLQLILLNVLFPTLTALLGYVFGTSRNSP